MNLNQIIGLCEGEILNETSDIKDFRTAFSSDLMSDVLRWHSDNMILITGLATIQTIRTAEISDLKSILFVRDKKATPEMIALAEQNGIVLLESPYSMFRAVGQLARAGIEPIF